MRCDDTPGSRGISTERRVEREAFQEGIEGGKESPLGEKLLTAFGLAPYWPCGDVMLSMCRRFLWPLSPWGVCDVSRE